MRQVTINPITRLEGHGKIEIFLKEDGTVDRTYLQATEFRGFEKFCEGRPAEELPRITTRICGVCPTAHHLASVKALDKVFGAVPTVTASKIRELMNATFLFEDHILHFFFLGGPDLLVGPEAPKEERNVLGVIAKVGADVGKQVIKVRGDCRHVLNLLGGKAIHPETALPGGMSHGVTEDVRRVIAATADEAVTFAQFALRTFEQVVLGDPEYRALLDSDAYSHETYYMGTVDADNRVSFYDGDIRVVSPAGKEVARFAPDDYLDYIGEQVESWSYAKFPFLKQVGWHGFVDGEGSGIYRVGPLARLNVSEGMTTPLADAEYRKLVGAFGGKPVHRTLAFHWARLVEALYAAERMRELAHDPDLTGSDIRNLPTRAGGSGVGTVEAPRGTLFHHYTTDGIGRVTGVNLIVASQNNAAAINLSVEKAAKKYVSRDNMGDGRLNRVEMAFRAYDPCYGCATHVLMGKPVVSIAVRDAGGEILRVWE